MIIFSDIDGTLVMHEDVHRLTELARGEERVLVRTPDEDIHSCYDVSTNGLKVFLDEKTRELGHKIRENNKFVYITAARKSTMDQRMHALDFYDALVCENGGIIYDENLQVDPEWKSLLAPEQKYLDELRAELESRGFVLDDKGRYTAIRVKRCDNPNMDELTDLALPAELKRTSNTGNLDIILRSSGKDNAVRYLMSKMGYSRDQSIGMEDDVNDIPMLRETGQCYVLAHAYPEMIANAFKRGWNISEARYFNGTNEILEKIIRSSA